ncbi:tetratricopeptide repeat protein [Hymenobacter monticola]|uniref:Tetratricopeptide repeat protein n=1 Tax=Hymenobacter monticola TaxID=1705399 RepID=A0ABY4BHV2_9BACT|nr:tetratricopeptide repeat protein [Hymenobacter monticola]UOE36190.1 tetratricopeptide repeat protein [Hymenobacter monticola]
MADLNVAVQQAAQLLDLHRPEEAATLLHRVLAQEPRHAHAMRLLGLSLLDRDDHAAAVEVLRQAVALDAQHPHGHACLAEAETALANWGAARLAISEALRLAPEHAPFHGQMAQLEFAQLRFRQALRAARAGLALDPTEALCHSVQGRALAALGHGEAGAALLTDALAHAPNSAALHTNLGLTHLDAGQHQEARTHFAAALRQQPNDDVARAGLLQAFKHKFWLYRVLSRSRRHMSKRAPNSSFWQLSPGTRAVVARLLVPALAVGLWLVGRATGVFDADASLRDAWNFLLLVLAVLALVVLTLRFSFLSLVRFDADARHLLSAREAANVNLFWLFLAAGAVVAAAVAGPTTRVGILLPLGLAVATPLLANRGLPPQAGWRWSWTWAGLLALLGYWVVGLVGSNPGEVRFGLGCVGAAMVLYTLVFEFYQPIK